VEETYAIQIPKATQADAERLMRLAAEHGIEGASIHRGAAGGMSAGGLKLLAASHDDAALLLELCFLERARALEPLSRRLTPPVTLAHLPRRAPRLDAAGREAWVLADGGASAIVTMRAGCLDVAGVAIEKVSPGASGAALGRLLSSRERREQLACACRIASDPFGAWLLAMARAEIGLLRGFVTKEDGAAEALLKGYWLLRHGAAGDLNEEHERVFARARATLKPVERDALLGLVPHEDAGAGDVRLKRR
jgi:hypothetical protein